MASRDSSAPHQTRSATCLFVSLLTLRGKRLYTLYFCSLEAADCSIVDTGHLCRLNVAFDEAGFLSASYCISVTVYRETASEKRRDRVVLSVCALQIRIDLI